MDDDLAYFKLQSRELIYSIGHKNNEDYSYKCIDFS